MNGSLHHWKLHNSGKTVLTGNEYRCSCSITKIVGNPVLTILRGTSVAIDDIVSKYYADCYNTEADMRRLQLWQGKIDKILETYEPKRVPLSEVMKRKIKRHGK